MRKTSRRPNRVSIFVFLFLTVGVAGISAVAESLPPGVSGQSVNMRFGSAAEGAPYSDWDELLFTFSGDGSLLLTDANTLFASSFTEHAGAYSWDNGTYRYELNLLNGQVDEVNLFDSGPGGAFLGQFTPFSSAGVDISAMTYLAGVYTVTGFGSPSQNTTHDRGTVIIGEQGNVDLETGDFTFFASDATEFYDRSFLLEVGIKRFDISYGSYNGISPNATVRLYLDADGALINIQLQNEPNMTTLFNLDVAPQAEPAPVNPLQPLLPVLNLLNE